MPKLVFDIETIGEDFDLLDHTTQEVLTRWLKKESYSEEEYKIELEELKEGLGFSPYTGSIVAIGVLDVEKNAGCVYFQDGSGKLSESEQDGIKFKPMSEKEMLAKFWEGAQKYQQFITFNGRGFDVPFMMVRSAVHGIRPTVNLMPPRYVANPNHIDLLDQISFLGSIRKKPNLHLCARAFGIKSPKSDGVTGEDVGRLYKEGKFIDIAKYNVGDLRATRELYLIWENYFRI
jgi:3'-5' exonuclease